MRGIYKKTLSFLLVAVFGLLLVGLTNDTKVKAEEPQELEAYLAIVSDDWSFQRWDADENGTNAKIDGDGKYTVGIDFSKVPKMVAKVDEDGKEVKDDEDNVIMVPSDEMVGSITGLGFAAIIIPGGDTAIPFKHLNITKVLFNGEERELDGVNYSNKEDKALRTNVFNDWITEVENGQNLDGSYENVTAKPLNVAKTEVIESLVIEFELVDGIKLGAIPLPEEGTKAFLNFADLDWGNGNWYGEENSENIKLTSDKIDGYGTYSVNVDFSEVEGGKLSGFVTLDLSIINGEKYFPWSYLSIDEFLVNGDAFAYEKAYYTDKDGDHSKVNIINTFANEIPELARFDKTFGKDNLKNVIVDEETLIDIVTMEITFTIHEGDVIKEEEFEMPEDFEAFMMYADGPEDWKVFDPIEGSSIRITGDGTYKITLTKEQAGATAKGQGAKVFLIDITDFGKAMQSVGTLEEDDNGDMKKTDLKVQIKVKVDGVEIAVNSSNIAVGDLENNGRLRLQLHNEYSDEISAIDPSKINPDSEITIEFTLSGSGIGEEVELPEEPETPEVPGGGDETPEVPTDKPKSNTGKIVLIILGSVAGAAIVVIGGVFGVKYFKNKKQ